MSINKQALRQLAEKATQGEWWSDVVETDGEYGDGEDRASGYHSYAVYVGSESLLDMTNSTAACIHTEWDHDYLMAWDETAKRNAEFIAAANPATVLALLDENIQLQREKDATEAVALALRDDMRQAREQLKAAEHTAVVDHEAACSLAEENEELKRRIAELESKNGYLRTIAHEQNELAIRANLDSINDAAEMDRLQKRIAETNQRNAELTARIESMDRRIAELERSETQLINERDHAESALADMYFAATGDRPEWSNCFSFSDAVDAVVDRIADLEAKQPSPVVLEGLVKAVRFYEQVKRENPPVETGAWKDAVDWVLKEACKAVNIGIKGE